MRKVIGIVTALGLSLTLAGCGGSSDKAEEPAPEETVASAPAEESAEPEPEETTDPKAEAEEFAAKVKQAYLDNLDADSMAGVISKLDPTSPGAWVIDIDPKTDNSVTAIIEGAADNPVTRAQSAEIAEFVLQMTCLAVPELDTVYADFSNGDIGKQAMRSGNYLCNK